MPIYSVFFRVHEHQCFQKASVGNIT